MDSKLTRLIQLITLHLEPDVKTDERVGVDLTLVATGIFQGSLRNGESPVAWITMMNHQTTVISVGCVTDCQQFDVIACMTQPRNLETSENASSIAYRYFGGVPELSLPVYVIKDRNSSMLKLIHLSAIHCV